MNTHRVIETLCSFMHRESSQLNRQILSGALVCSPIYVAHLRTIVLTDSHERPVSHSDTASRSSSVVNESIASPTPISFLKVPFTYGDLMSIFEDAQNKASKNCLTAYVKNDVGDVTNLVRHLSVFIPGDFATWSEASHKAFDHGETSQRSLAQLDIIAWWQSL
ncbi:uncharacterized protein EAF02_007855 [Botrytis sinoallii]|uniref:uncharacterized protein n=1 Tax=Botrytis sinoallii TaxID=1463999 RepID=UPI00190165ED|nr:uncharacterized protein EAF02_007855 [Botrytis sinoallii]KAF7879685.1 hypothetical protein EAF02_007855 [Botrytis sinoallii]